MATPPHSRRHPLISFALTTFLLFAPVAVAAQEPARRAAMEEQAPATRVTEVEGITEYRLSNGLRVLLFPDAGKQTMTVNVTYFVGSRHEGYGETGMAHLLEHLAFKGTPDHPDIPQELTEHGARPNGTTWYDRTNYFETFRATDENLEWALDLEADRMVNSFIAREDLDSEMTVVRNEFEAGENSPYRVLMERTLSTAYLWHNYGKSTIGARADIENVPIERLQGFYRKYYQPDNAMLVVAGRFDPEPTLELIQEKFGSIPSPERVGGNRIFSTYTAEPAQDGERTVTLKRVGDTQLIMSAYHVPAGSHEDFPAVSVLAYVLGDEPSGRLYKALVEPGKAANTGAFAWRLREPGVLLAFAEVRTEDSLEEARTTLESTIDDAVGARPPTGEEVERAKNAILKNMELAYNNPERIALELSEWAANGDWRLRFIYRDRLKKVTAQEVGRIAEAYLKPANRTLGMFIPVDETPPRAEVPAVPDVETMVAGYTSAEAVAMGEAFDPSTENIEARTERREYDSGFELALLPKETRGDNVVAILQLRFGTKESLTGLATAGDLAGSMLMRGTKKRGRQELLDEIDRLKAQVFVGGDATFASARIETTRENFPSVLRLVGEILREPAFDESEWETMKEERLAAIESQRSEPTAIASRTFARHMNPRPTDDPDYIATFDEEIAAVQAATLEDALRFWEEFYGADGMTMAVVGDFDPDQVRTITEELFGGWKASKPYVRIARTYQNVRAEHQLIETPDKANAMMRAGLNLPIRDDSPDYPAMVLGGYMLGGGFLNSRLATRIRQKEGLSYGVGAFFNAHPIDERGSLSAYAIFAPQNAEKLERAFREEIQKVLDEGFTAEEVKAAKDGWLQSREVSRAQDMSVANMLSASLFYDRTLAFDAELERKVAELTPERIRVAMRKYIDPQKITVIMAGDFAGARKTGEETQESGG